MITHQHSSNPVPRTQTSLCLSARYALTPRRAVTRVPSSIDIDIPGTLRLFFVGTRDKNAAEPLYDCRAADQDTMRDALWRFCPIWQVQQYAFCFWQVQYAFWPVLVDCMQMHGTRGTAHAWHNGFPRPPVTPAHLTHVELLRLPPLTSFAHSQSSAIALEPTSNPPDEEVLDDRAWVSR